MSVDPFEVARREASAERASADAEKLEVYKNNFQILSSVVDRYRGALRAEWYEPTFSDGLKQDGIVEFRLKYLKGLIEFETGKQIVEASRAATALIFMVGLRGSRTIPQESYLQIDENGDLGDEFAKILGRFVEMNKDKRNKFRSEVEFYQSK